MGAPPVDPYIIYGFWAFISLLLIAMLAMLFRNARDIGEQKGEFRAINTRLDETNRRIDEVNANLTNRIDEVNTNLTNRIDEVNANLTSRMESLERRHESLERRYDGLERRIENLEQGVASLREHVAREMGEIRGLLLALHERVDLVMRHRHDDGTGEVVLTPEQAAAD